MTKTPITIDDLYPVSEGSANNSIEKLTKLEGFVDVDVIAVASANSNPVSEGSANNSIEKLTKLEGFVDGDVIAVANLI